MFRYAMVICISVTLIAVMMGAGQARAEEPAAADNASPAAKSKEIVRLREEAKNRKRRIIYNSDGGDMYGYDFSSVEEFLRRRTERAIGTQVDSMFYCTGDTSIYSHETDIAERFDDLMDAIEKSSEQAMRWRNNMAVLRRAGVDQLSATIRRAHQGGLEVFWSHRINDTHDSVPEWDHLLSQWKRNHPEYLMGVPEDTKKYPQSSPKYWWSTLDFEKPQVRDYLFRVTEDVCQRYDGDDIAAAARQKALSSAVPKVQLGPPKSLDAVEVRLNGKLLTPTAKDTEEGWLTFSPEPAWYRVGDNRVSFRLAKTSGNGHISIQVLAVQVHVKYRK